jgi:hypothetical protein
MPCFGGLCIKDTTFGGDGLALINKHLFYHRKNTQTDRFNIQNDMGIILSLLYLVSYEQGNDFFRT